MVIKNSTEVWPTTSPKLVGTSRTIALPRTSASQKTTRKDTLTKFVCASLLVSALLALVALRISQFRLGYRLSALTQESSVLIEKQRALMLELAVLKNPKRIMSIVGSKLSLGPARAHQILKIRE